MNFGLGKDEPHIFGFLLVRSLERIVMKRNFKKVTLGSISSSQADSVISEGLCAQRDHTVLVSLRKTFLKVINMYA